MFYWENKDSLFNTRNVGPLIHYLAFKFRQIEFDICIAIGLATWGLDRIDELVDEAVGWPAHKFVFLRPK